MSTNEQRWFFRNGQLSRDGWQSVVDDTHPGWQHTGIRIAEISDGDALDLSDTSVERIIVPLAGSFTVTHRHHPGKWETRLHGRRSVFHGTTDVLYLPCGVTVEERVYQGIATTWIVRNRAGERVSVYQQNVHRAAPDAFTEMGKAWVCWDPRHAILMQETPPIPSPGTPGEG